jgi:uncharacterized Zn-finger protein
VLDLLAATTTSDTSGPFNGVSAFFDSSYFAAFEKLMIIFVVAFYLALIFWTAKDARRRIEDPVIVAVCIATAFFFPFVGVLVYLILRPPEYLADVREREPEIKAVERRLGADSVCPYCRNPAEASFLSCPHCGTKLKQACRRCKAPLEPSWRLCPYCETATVQTPAVAERTRREPTTERPVR